VRVLVTGASGFVGGALVQRLVAEGVQVRGTWRRASPPAVHGVEWRQLSRLDASADLDELVRDCEVVIHLAALAHQHGRAAVGRWDEFSRVNIEGTRALALASRAAHAARFVFVSSVAAICSQSEVPVDEHTLPTPDSDYGRSKLEGEHALQEVLRDCRTDWCILRPPLTYGPGNPGNMQRLMKLLATGWPLPFGSIRNRRSFVFVDNLVDALVKVIRHPHAIRSAYMLSDDSNFTTPELVTALATAMGRSATLVRTPVVALRALGRIGDVVERVFGRGLGLDSYSIDRLLGSLPVNSARFRESFVWSPPLGRVDAIELTCKLVKNEARGL
jgi:nucleoside-diphosphate-sugar epimerase